MWVSAVNVRKKTMKDRPDLGRGPLEELYDLRKDPGCLNNLAGNKNSHSVLKEFRTEMANFLRKTQDHELGNYLTFLDTQKK